MNSEDSERDILLLEQELLSDDDLGGHEAFPFEPDVLLLDMPVPVVGPVMTIDVGRVRPAHRIPEPRFGPVRIDARNSASSRQETESPAATDFRVAADHLHDLLSIARHAAAVYSADDARTRKSLYTTLAGAYDLSLAVMLDPRGFARLLDRAGLKMQDRAPMTPILKLVFGPDYDKTRLTEYAAVLAHGHRKLVPPGRFGEFLEYASGGLKGIIEVERVLRKGEDGSSHPAERHEPRRSIAKYLRKLTCRSLDEFGSGEDEFTLVIARRSGDGTIAALGEVPRDISLLERAARRLLAEQQCNHDHSPNVEVPKVTPASGFASWSRGSPTDEGSVARPVQQLSGQRD